jgi:hypothetical protein
MMPFQKSLSGAQLVQQRLSLFQIERIEAIGETAIDRGEQIAGVITLALQECGVCHDPLDGDRTRR